jgi:RNA polymerase sigma-70 factor (ECF subfamily)
MASIDPTQLSGWFTAYSDRLALYARQWLDMALAEDVVQDVFLKMASLETVPSNVPAWLFRSVRNAAITQLRARHRRQRHEEKRTAQRPAWFSSPPEDGLDPGQVQTALEGLTEEQREIVVLKIWGKMTLRDIAEIVEEPMGTVYSRYRLALDCLRKTMEEYHEK